MAAKQSERIKLWGIVQGVGFRPYVAKTAAAFHMKGHVLNIGGLVEITVTDTAERISAFLHALIEHKPAPSEIVHIKREPAEYREFDDFSIIKSDTGDDEAAMIPADLAICPSCLKELYDEQNPRYQHPFISCMVCGPRYTIIDKIPYDRENTSMVDFPMCDFCDGEYTDLHDRRYHAQTISCHDCGPSLLWKSAADQPASNFMAQAGDSAKSSKNCAGPAKDCAKSSVKDFPEQAGDCTEPAGVAAVLDAAATVLKNGGVILFKSVGGYNLVADPFSEKAVAALRHIKNREEKPFAVMFQNPEQIREFCSFNAVEEKLLTSSARPILLLEHRLNEGGPISHERNRSDTDRSNHPNHVGHTSDMKHSIHTDGDDLRELKKSRFIGSFLPSFAAQYLLLDRISPLIFTSANLSDMPMIKDDAEAFSLLKKNPSIQGILYNERQIRVRADDSVARVIDGQPQMIRRSKGYAPVPLYVNVKLAANRLRPNQDADEKVQAAPLPQIFAAGSQLKNSFALTKGNFVYMSQFFGDMDTLENQRVYEENTQRLKSLFRITPQAVVCDMHPLYFTTQFAEQYAAENNLPLIKVQHHHAHVASVMAENDLNGKVIGVSFDGTGYGTDGNIWGGEFFLCEGADAERIAHLNYVDMIGGDSSVKDAVRSALSYIHAHNQKNETIGNSADLRSSAPDKESIADNSQQITIDLSDIIAFGAERLLDLPAARLVMPALDAKINTIKSSSMGRLFDAVSALLHIKDYNDYEGQCAIMLEDAAAFAQKHPGERESCDLALSFHNKIINVILEQCQAAREKYHTDQVALTGGTFQNKILMEGVLKKLRADAFQPYYNISVSPNDGGIALGQAYIAMHRMAH